METEQCSKESPLGQGRNKKKMKDFLEFNTKECTNIPKPIKYYKSSANRKVHSTKCLHKESDESSH